MSERQGDDWSGEISLYGHGLVQAEGQVDGKPWYFRARGAGWSFEVADDPLCPDANWVSSWGESGFCLEEDYPGDAGLLDADAAWVLIQDAIARFRRQGGASRQPDGVLQLVRCLKWAHAERVGWRERWSAGGREPVAAAWAASTDGDAMVAFLDFLAHWRLRPALADGDRRPPSLEPLYLPQPRRHRQELAIHVRQLVPEVPSFEDLLAKVSTLPRPPES